VIFVALVVLGQLTDLLSFVGDMRLAAPGGEVGPLAPLLATFGVGGAIAVKLLALVAIGLGAYALRQRRQLLSSLALIGFLGALVNLTALL
jgi:hypothetical protein